MLTHAYKTIQKARL